MGFLCLFWLVLCELLLATTYMMQYMGYPWTAFLILTSTDETAPAWVMGLQGICILHCIGAAVFSKTKYKEHKRNININPDKKA